MSSLDAMRVWVLRNPDGSFRGKFHRRDAIDCPGRRRGEEDRDDYVLVELEELPDWYEACQFEACFRGYKDAGAVAGRSRSGSEDPLESVLRPRRAGPGRYQEEHAQPPDSRTGITIGTRVTFRDVSTGSETDVTIVAEAPDAAMGEVSASTPVAAALLGREVGDTVEIARPKGGRRRVEIVSADPPGSA